MDADLNLSTVALAFAAGFVSFISPCVLPLLPAYLSYISGVEVSDLDREQSRVVWVACFFVAGFTAVFVALGAGAGGVGDLLREHRGAVTVAAGVFMVVSGLAVAGVLPLPARGFALEPRRGGSPAAFLTGAAFAVSWTPCVGYVLSGILILASSQGSALEGAALLLVYSLGLGLPFIVAAVTFRRVTAGLAVVKRHFRVVQAVSGAILVAFGVLVLSGGLESLTGRLSGLSPFGF